MYSRDLSNKIRSASMMKMQRGEFTGLPPYGYKSDEDKKTLIPDGDAADIVRMIFDMRIAGSSANSIACHLNREGVPSPQNRRYQLGKTTKERFAKRILWEHGNISNILKCEAYTGTLVQGMYKRDGKRSVTLPEEQWIRHENSHQAIIGREQYDTVQALVREAADKYKPTGNGGLPENRYSGKIFCTRCGRSVSRSKGGSKESGFLQYYFCRSCNGDLKNNQGLTKRPKLKVLALDAAVMTGLRKQMDMLVDIDRLARQMANSEMQSKRRTELQREIIKLNKTVADADGTLSSAYAHHLDGLLDLREFGLVRTKMEHNRNDAMIKLALAESELKKCDEMTDRHCHWRSVYDDFLNAETPSKRLIQALICKIELTPVTNEVNIIFNYRDGLDEYRGMLGESGVRASA